MDLTRIDAHIDAQFDRHLDRVRAFVRQPSISPAAAGSGAGRRRAASTAATTPGSPARSCGWSTRCGRWWTSGSGSQLNVDGLADGHFGAGTKTLLPHEVRVKMDVRLVPGMEPDEVRAKITAHLRKIGCADFEVEFEEGYPWARMSPSASLSQAMVRSIRVFGMEPQIWRGRHHYRLRVTAGRAACGSARRATTGAF